MLTYYRSLLQSLFAMLLIGILVVEVLMWQIDVSARSQSAQQLLSRGADVRSVLETRLRDGIYLTRGLVSFLHSQQGLRDQKNVEDWLASMLEEVDYLINIGIAPNNRIELIYPREGNEAALGLAYSDVPAQWSAVQEIMSTGKPVLAGPLNLVQGGSGLVYRSPVYLDGRYWGLVSTVMDASALLGILDTEPRWQDLNVQLQRGQDRRAETFTRIWGADLIPGLPQQAMLIELPSVTWRLIVQPRSEQTHGVLYRVGLYVLLLLILLAVGYTSAAHIRQRR